MSILLYTLPNNDGRMFRFDRDTPVLPSAIDGLAESLIVDHYSIPMRLFPEQNFQGQYVTLVQGGGCNDLHNIPGAGDWFHRVRSIQFLAAQSFDIDDDVNVSASSVEGLLGTDFTDMSQFTSINEASGSELPVFIVQVTEMTEQYVKVLTCGGDVIKVSTKLLSSFRRIGFSGNQIAAAEPIIIARMVIDSSTEEGATILQLAESLRHSLDTTTRINTDIRSRIYSTNTVKVSVSGTACQDPPGFGYYKSDKQITGYAFKQSDGCSAGNFTQIGNTIRFNHFASNGTFCGTGYSGTVYIDVATA